MSIPIHSVGIYIVYICILYTYIYNIHMCRVYPEISPKSGGIVGREKDIFGRGGGGNKLRGGVLP